MPDEQISSGRAHRLGGPPRNGRPSAAIVPRGDKPHASARLIDYFSHADLDWNDSTATVRFGLILSGEKLVDNRDYREQLRHFEPEAVGGEMEGAGLYVACQDAKVDWIVVKAICDWADGNKKRNKTARQRLAARRSGRDSGRFSRNPSHEIDD